MEGSVCCTLRSHCAFALVVRGQITSTPSLLALVPTWVNSIYFEMDHVRVEIKQLFLTRMNLAQSRTGIGPNS